MAEGELNVLYVGLKDGALEAKYSRKGFSWHRSIPIVEGSSPRPALSDLAKKIVQHEIFYSAEVETPTPSLEHVSLLPSERNYLEDCIYTLTH